MKCTLAEKEHPSKTNTRADNSLPKCTITRGSLMPVQIKNYLGDRCDGIVGFEDKEDTETIVFQSDPHYEIQMGRFFYDLIGDRKMHCN